MDKERSIVTLDCVDIDANNEFERWFPLRGRGFLAAMKRLLCNEVKNKLDVQLQVKFTPCEKNPLYEGGIGAQYALRKSYFPLWPHGKVTLYQDAHCVHDQMEITLENGIFKRGTCWEDICHAISSAKKDHLR